MKKYFVYAIAMITAFGFVACSDETLETSPTEKVSGSGMFNNATAALLPLNGIYRMMYTQDWSTTANVQQCDGLTAWNLAADVMGDDMIMAATGSGWYWYDCTYGVKSRYTSSAWRSYDLWNGYYTLISNANYIIAAEGTMEGAEADVNYVVGQAYAIRAYCYNQLALYFARAYDKDDANRLREKCVPIYTEPTAAGTPGKARASIKAVYTQIRTDIDKAVTLLENAPAQKDKTHIDYCVANGIKARICLVTGEWSEAAKAAKLAQANYTIGKGTELTGGMNNVANSNVMWGATVIQDQVPGWGPFLYHLDGLSMLPTQNYGFAAPKCLNADLYARLGSKDIRKNWWLTEDQAIAKVTAAGVNYSELTYSMNLMNNKFRFSDAVTGLGDKLWMRVEEMYLIEAEADCRLSQEKDACNILNNLIKTRDEAYNCTKTGTTLGALTSDITGSLLEEILIQRRIELWGEFGRLYDIKRLKQGFTRTTAQGWPTSALIDGTDTKDPNTWAWVMTIPQHEFDGNINMNNQTDQNPVGTKGPWDESNIYAE